MGGGEGNKGGFNKGDDAENMCGSSLEPDSRYDSCCSSIFRPGRVLRDLVVGFLVVLGIAVVIAVLFVVCIFFVPADEQKETGDVLGKTEPLSGGLRGGPREVEININEVDIIEFGHTDGHDHEAELTGDSTKYDVETDKARYDLSEEPETEPEPNSEPGTESETEPENEPEPEYEPEPETEPESDNDHDHVSHHHNHGSDDVEHNHSHTDHNHTDHKHEHPNHHLEHLDHDDKQHMHIEEVPAHQQPDEQMDNGHMDHDMDHTDQMDHIELDQHDDQMDQTGPMDHSGQMGHGDQKDHTDHLDNVDQTEHGEHMPHGDQGVHGEHMHKDDDHHMATFSHFDHKEMNQSQEDLVMTEEHSDINPQPEFGDPASNPPFAPSAPLFDENAAIMIVNGPTLESDIPTERFDEDPLESEVETEILRDVVIEETLPPLLEILSPGPQENLDGFMEDLLVTDSPAEEDPVFPDGALEEVLPPVLLPVEFPSEEPSFRDSDFPAEIPVTQIADIPEPELTGSCRPRSLEMCSDMPYASTMLPNWVNDQNSEDLLNVSLPYFRDIIVRSSCSPRARSFACAVLEPSCVMDPSGQDTILPPCRSFCRSVGTTCAEFIISGLALSEVFDCERFPDSTDPSVCFDMSQAPVDDIKVTPETSLPSSFDYIQDPSSINTGIQEFNSPDYADAQDYSDFSPNVNDASFGDDLISIAPENPTEFVGETSNPGQEAPLGSADQTSNATEESEVIVNQQILDEAFESVEPSPAGEVASQPELLEETPEAPLICTLDMFLCWDGSDCLDNSALCDDYPHCIDASDEYNCTAPPIECAGDDFRCATTSYCVPRSWLCDGADDCRDNSDEENCDASGLPLTAGAALGLENLSALGQFPPPSSFVGNSFTSDNPYPNDIDRNDRDERAFEGSIPSEQALFGGPPPTENDLSSITGLDTESESKDGPDSVLQQDQFLTNPTDAPAGLSDEVYVPPSLPGPEFSLVDNSQQQFSVEELKQFNTQGSDYVQQSREIGSNDNGNKPEELLEQILDQDQFLTFQEEPINNEAHNFDTETGLQEQPTDVETKTSVDEIKNIDTVPTNLQDFEANPELPESLIESENFDILSLEPFDASSIQTEYIPEESQGFETFVEEPQNFNTFSESQQGFEAFPDIAQDFHSLPNQPLDLFDNYQDEIQTLQNEEPQEVQNNPEKIQPENNLLEINDQFDNVFNDQAEESFVDLNEQQSQDFQLSNQGGEDTSLSEPSKDGSSSSLTNDNIQQDEPQEEFNEKSEEKSQTVKSSEWTTLSPIEEEMMKKGEVKLTRNNPLTKTRLTRRPSFPFRSRKPTRLSIRQTTSTTAPSITTATPKEEPETVTRASSNTRISFKDRFKNRKANNNKPSSIINDPIPSKYESRRTSSSEERLSNSQTTRRNDQTPQTSARDEQVVSSNLSENRRPLTIGRLTSRGRGRSGSRTRELSLRRTRLTPNSQESNQNIQKNNALADAPDNKPEIKSEASIYDEIIDNGDIPVALPISIPEDIVHPASYLSNQYAVGLRRGQSIIARPNQSVPLYLPYPYSGDTSSQSAVPASEPFETATTIEFISEPQDFFGFSTFTPLEDLPQPFEQTTEVGFDEPTTFSLFDIVPPSDCELTCLDGTCITVEQLNNGVSDCPDGTDEKNMPK